MNGTKCNPYRECVGRLTNLMRTRPDLAFPVSVVIRNLHNRAPNIGMLSNESFDTYCNTVNMEMEISPCDFTTSIATLQQLSKDLIPLTGNTDANWNSNAERGRSISGYAFFMDSGLISWISKLQSTTATSSTHAEYICYLYRDI
jgi:hypothetical protein